MAEVLLFHHAHGVTPGVLSFADELRAAGYKVHVPDLFEGKTFAQLNDGLAYAEKIGFGTLIERGMRTADGLPDELVYAGFSLGVMPAQKLAQTRPGSLGALLVSAFIPVAEFGDAWPRELPVQIHMMEADEFVQEYDLPAARELSRTTAGAELFLYPGDRHLFADNSLPDYDADAAKLVMQRSIRLLESLTR